MEDRALMDEPTIKIEVLPEHVKHIADSLNRIEYPDGRELVQSLCGIRIGFWNKGRLGGYFCFLDLEHWFNTVRSGGRLLACPDCITVLEKAISDGVFRWK